MNTRVQGSLTFFRKRVQGLYTLFRRSIYLKVGFSIILPIFFLGFIVPLVVPDEGMKVASFDRNILPSLEHLLGTDHVGSDIFTTLVYALRESLKIGLLAGTVGTLLGLLIGSVTGYRGGTIGSFIMAVTDIFLVIPLWPLMVMLTAYLSNLSPIAIALLLSAFSWPGPSRGIRSQVLSLRERGFVKLAKLSGEGSLEIVFKEILPNMLPYIGVSFAGAITHAMVVEVGLTIVGIAAVGETTLGLMIHFATFYGALTRGMWWWIAPPAICLAGIFIGFQLINIGLDEIYNPRLRK